MMSIEYVRFKVEEKMQPDFIKTIKQACIILQEFEDVLGVEFTQSEEDKTLFVWRIEWPSTAVHMENFKNDRLYHDFHQLIEPYVSMVLDLNHYQRI